MSDIKNEVKEAIENFKIGKTVNLSNKQLITWLSCFLTTIESQQEEINELEMEMVLTERVVTKKEEMLKDVENRMSEVIDSRDKALDQIESLKAITELTVKGLREIVKGDESYHTTVFEARDWIDKIEVIADSTLSEIEKLQNE